MPFDSDSSVELVFSSGSSMPKKSHTDNAESSFKLASSAQKSVPESKNLQQALTHYRCIKFDQLSEIELAINKWNSNADSLERDHHGNHESSNMGGQGILSKGILM